MLLSVSSNRLLLLSVLVTLGACRPGLHHSDVQSDRSHNLDYLSRELGSGFNSLENIKAPRECVNTENITYSGMHYSELELLNDATTDDLIDQTSAGIFAQANFLGFVKAKVSGDIITTLATTDQTGAMIYRFQTVGKVAGLREVRLTTDGQTEYSKNDALNFREKCGDHFVDQVFLGGKLFIALKYTFTSREAKEKLRVQLKGSILWDLIKFSKEWSQEDRDLLKNVRVSVEAFQIGGIVQRLDDLKTKIHQGSCGPDDADKCSQTLDQLLEYARNDFPTQLNDLRVPTGDDNGPAILSVNVKPYDSASVRAEDGQVIRIGIPPGLTPNKAVSDALKTLDTLAIDLKIEMNRAKALNDFPLSPEEKARIEVGLGTMTQVSDQLPEKHGLCTKALKDPALAGACTADVGSLQKKATEALNPIALPAR